MAMLTCNLLPVVERRRRPIHRDFQGDTPAAARPVSADRALAVVAGATVRRARRPERRPARWTLPVFAREVDLIRLHLAPIRSRRGLAASFGREAFHGDIDPGIADGESVGPVTVAYAIRWLELGDGAPRPPWTTWRDQSREWQPREPQPRPRTGMTRG
jgi:hypothetical protein